MFTPFLVRVNLNGETSNAIPYKCKIHVKPVKKEDRHEKHHDDPWLMRFIFSEK